MGNEKKFDKVFLEEMPPINKAELIALLSTYQGMYLENVFGIDREVSRNGIYQSAKQWVLSGTPENLLKESGIGRDKKPKTKVYNLKDKNNGK